MSIDEKIEHYYSMILEETNIINSNAFNKDCLIYNQADIQQELREIIENNYEFILTPVMIKYIVKESYYLFDDYHRMLYRNLYLLTLEEGESNIYVQFIKWNYDGYKQNKSLTEYEYNIFKVMNERIDDAIATYEYRPDLFLKKDIFAIIAAHIFRNNKSIDDFNSYLDSCVENWQEKLDAMKLQFDISSYPDSEKYIYKFKELNNYILKQLGNNKREIR